MQGKKTSGFTIIESMLFLAISGVLVVSLIAGTGVSINIQRYRDAVETLKAHIQNQYDEISSVHNDRDDSWYCTSNADTDRGAASEDRGQSQCVLLGRYVTIQGDTIKTSSVTARLVDGSIAVGNDIDRMRDSYVLGLSSVYQDETTLEWGASIKWPSAGDSESRTGNEARDIAILIVRSPDSGLVYTFTSDDVPEEPSNNSLKSMIVAASEVPGRAPRTICIEPGGIVLTNVMAVYLSEFANGPNSVETRTNDFLESLGDSTRC